VQFRGKSVADLLAMRIDEATDFFRNFSRLHGTLQTFVSVGLGYLTLGQSSRTLSGGEAQRVMLASELSRVDALGRTFFVLDEPTTGLHPLDVARLLDLLQRLVEQGNSVLVIEHNLDVIAAADWVIDLGPDAGAAGGRIVSVGTPERMAECVASRSGQALQAYFNG
jgi:excinuclease ABC subunit A